MSLRPLGIEDVLVSSRFSAMVDGYTEGKAFRWGVVPAGSLRHAEYRDYCCWVAGYTCFSNLYLLQSFCLIVLSLFSGFGILHLQVTGSKSQQIGKASRHICLTHL